MKFLLLAVPFAVANPDNIKCDLTTTTNGYNLKTTTSAVIMGAQVADSTTTISYTNQNAANKVYASSSARKSELTIRLANFVSGAVYSSKGTWTKISASDWTLAPGAACTGTDAMLITTTYSAPIKWTAPQTVGQVELWVVGRDAHAFGPLVRQKVSFNVLDAPNCVPLCNGLAQSACLDSCMWNSTILQCQKDLTTPPDCGAYQSNSSCVGDTSCTWLVSAPPSTQTPSTKPPPSSAAEKGALSLIALATILMQFM